MTNNKGDSARVTVRRNLIQLDFAPFDKKLMTSLPLNDDQIRDINAVLKHMRSGQLALEAKIRDAGGKIPTLASFRDMILPTLFRQLERGDILKAQKSLPNPFSDISDDECYEVVAKNKKQQPVGTFQIRRVAFKTDLCVHWTIIDPTRNRMIRIRYAPDDVFPSYIDKLSTSGSAANGIVIDKSKRIPKRMKTRRAAQAKLDERIKRRFAEVELRLRSEMNRRLAEK